jgi:hypothetical protein
MATILRFDTKPPGDLDSFTLDFTKWVTPGDTIVSAAVATSPSDLVVSGSPTIDSTGLLVSVWLTGGTSSTDYTVSFTVVTALGRHATRSAHLYCGSSGV